MINVALLGVLTTNIIGYMQNGHGEPDFLLDQVQPQLKLQATNSLYLSVPNRATRNSNTQIVDEF